MQFLGQRLHEIKENLLSDENRNRFSRPHQGAFTLILPGQIDELFTKVQREPYLSNTKLRADLFLATLHYLIAESGYFSQPAATKEECERDHAVLRSLFGDARDKVNGAIARTVRPPMRG